MTRPLKAAALALLVLSVACGAGPSAAPPSSTGPSATGAGPGVTSPSPGGTTASGQPVGSSGPRYPNVDRYADPLERLAYRSALDACAIAGAEMLASDYGGSAADPASVARAYARFVNPTHEDASAQGCLDALQPAGPPS